MAKEKGTDEHLKLALDYLHRKLDNPIFKVTQSPLNENEFPLLFLPRERTKDRASIWDEISGLSKHTLQIFRSAIPCFSRLLIAQHVLKALFPELIAQNNKLRKNLSHKLSLWYEILIYEDNEQTNSFIDAEIKKTSTLLESYKRPGRLIHLSVILEINDIIADYYKEYDRAVHERMFAMLGGKYCNWTTSHVKGVMLSKYGKFYLLPPIGRPQNMIFNAFILVVLLEILKSEKIKRQDAEILTANLINEYCHYNPFLTEITNIQTQKKISDLYDNSCCNEEPLYKLRPLRNITKKPSGKSD